MRLVAATIALSLALAAGCGGNTVAGGEGGGGSSSSGTGGSGGSTGGGPTGCPASEPAGGSCAVEGLRCTYGDSVRPDCRADWTCLSGSWTATGNACVEPPPGSCDFASPPTGQVCATDGDICVLDTTICICASCLGPCSPPPPKWSCSPPPTTPGCPEIVPNDGSACTQTGLECVYGNPCAGSGAHAVCKDGAWTWQTEIACPV